MPAPCSFVVSIMSRDRVGIVAEVSGVIQRLGGNLADVSQTVLRGYFTMILLAEFPDAQDADRIRAAFAECKPLAGAEIGVLPFHGAAEAPPQNFDPEAPVADNRYVLTATGPDRPGLVNAIAGYLRERDINIVDLTTGNHDGEYTMIWLVDLPRDLEVTKLKRSLEVNLDSLKMKIALRHQAIFKQTNEI